MLNKNLNIAISIAVVAFLATNFYLLFSDKSVIEKSVYIKEYERLVADDFHEETLKEALVVPSETYTVYADDDETIEEWLVTEGEPVFPGQELALLDTRKTDRSREVVEAQYDGLIEQKNELESMIAELLSAQSLADTTTYSDVNRTEGLGGTTSENTLELDVNFSVDVTQGGSYTEAISAAEQQLADVAKQLVVAEAQLAQDPMNPALISPVDGVVSTITRSGSTLSIDIFSSQKEILTYALDDEWQEIETGDRAFIQGNGIDGVEEGSVVSVSTVHAKENELLSTYKTLDKDEAINPIAYYEVRIQPDNELETVPFSHNVNAVVVTNEVTGAVSVNEKWLHNQKDETAQGTILTELGRSSVVSVDTPFTWRKRAIVTNGLLEGDIATKDFSVDEYEYDPRVYLPIPDYFPTKEEWKSFGWKNYVRYMLVK